MDTHWSILKFLHRHWWPPLSPLHSRFDRHYPVDVMSEGQALTPTAAEGPLQTNRPGLFERVKGIFSGNKERGF